MNPSMIWVQRFKKHNSKEKFEDTILNVDNLQPKALVSIVVTYFQVNMYGDLEDRK